MLMEDCILHAVKKDSLQVLEDTGIELYALRDSVAARGFPDEFPDNVSLVETAEIPRMIMEDFETSITL